MIGRLKLTKSIHKRFGSVSFNKLYQAVSIIIDQISNDLVSDQVVTVKRFGTLSPHLRVSHIAHNVNNGTIHSLKPKRSVKFHPHASFSALIKERQGRFLERGDEKVLDQKRKV